MEENRATKLDYYLAQIAASIYQVNAGKLAKNIRVENFLIKIVKKTKTIPSKVSQKIKQANSKHYWLSALGLSDKIKKS